MNAEQKIKKKPETHVSEEKKKIVSELGKLIKENKTIFVASIKNIPGGQFQEIVKTLRGKAVAKVPKKNLMFRAIDKSGNAEIKDLKEKIKEDVVILFSNIDSFELASELVKSKRPAKAKPGQIAPMDIEIPEGPTELVPGPAITELGALNIPIQITGGKIHIKQAKVIAKQGEAISKGASELMSKLGIKPFTIGFIPICSFDNEEKRLYVGIKIDPEEAISELQNAFGRALPFAVEIGYVTKETITFMIGKAASHEKAIGNLLGKEEVAEEKTEEPVKEEVAEEAKEEKTETVEESKIEEKKEETQTETKSEEEK
jgi:large subunit ribosomal protein L10